MMSWFVGELMLNVEQVLCAPMCVCVKRGAYSEKTHILLFFSPAFQHMARWRISEDQRPVMVDARPPRLFLPSPC